MALRLKGCLDVIYILFDRNCRTCENNHNIGCLSTCNDHSRWPVAMKSDRKKGVPNGLTINFPGPLACLAFLIDRTPQDETVCPGKW